MTSIQMFIASATYFIGNVLIPFLFGLALLFFLFNAARYFIIGGSDAEAQGKAKTMALYGIIAFVFLISVWGIVNVLVYGLGFGNDNALDPDYFGTGGQQGYFIQDGGFGSDYGSDYGSDIESPWVRNEDSSWDGGYDIDQSGPQ